MSKTVSIVLSTVYSAKTVKIRAKLTDGVNGVYTVSRRQLKTAEQLIGMMKGDTLTMHDTPNYTDYWTWNSDGSLTIKMHCKLQ